MNAPGHLSVSVLLGLEASPVSRATLLAVTAGGLLPDLVDKSLRLAGVYPWGRTIGHAAICWLCLCVVYALIRRPWLRWLIIGGVGHLWADIIDDTLLAFLHEGPRILHAWFAWPFATPDDVILRGPAPLVPIPAVPVSGLEIGTVILALLAAARAGVQRDRSQAELPSPRDEPRSLV